jgi:hypothetical protein
MVNYSNPFLTSFLGSRNQFTQPQNQFNQQQNQYDFSGWGDRLNKIEEGIASLTNQFNNFQKPGDVAPEYQGNIAPEPLEQTTNTPEPLGGIESLVAEPWQQGNMTSMGHTQPSPPGGASFTLGSGDPRDAYMEAMGIQGTPTNVLESMGVHGMGQKDKDPMGWMNQPSRPVSPLSQHLMDGEWRQLTPEEFGTKFPNSPFNQNGTMQQPNQPFQTFASPGGGKSAEQFQSGNLVSYPPNMPQSTNPMAYATINPNLDAYGPGAGLAGLAAYQAQQNKGVGI